MIDAIMRPEYEEMVDYKVYEMVWLELDYAVAAFAYGHKRRFLTDEQIEIYQRIPKDWYTLASLVLPDTDEHFMLFEMLGMLCPKGFMYGATYREIREYLDNIGYLEWEGFLETSGADSIADYMMLLAAKHQEGLVESYLNLPRLHDVMVKTAEHIEKIYTAPKFSDGFWRCMDIFVEHYYLRWRKQHEDQMAERKQFFEDLRKKPGGLTMSALLEVLPKTNALHYRSALRKLVLMRQLRLVIWIEPIGLFDSWTIFRNRLVISVSEPETLFQFAKDEISELADKGKALGDPTRLGILRVIRHFDMDITELANYFGVSRPTMSLHVKKLREAGLVDSIEEGRSTRHVLNRENIRALLDEIEEFLELG
jgi:ArsR family transcriptional regulator, arsenate/arsenite/antimonite-responsive transcriptional repressor